MVLDEADRLLDPSFSSELKCIRSFIEGTHAMAVAEGVVRRPYRLQTLLFSATFTDQLVQLQKEILDPATHVFKAYDGLKIPANLREEMLFVPAKVKDVYLYYVLTHVMPERQVRSAIIFTATKDACHLVGLILEELGIKAVTLHSGKTQRDRLASLALFKSETVPLLIATDVASRGLDIPTVDAVIHYDIPRNPADYVHRSGRTARAGRGGWSLSLVTQHDVGRVQGVEKETGNTMNSLEALKGALEAEALKSLTKVYAAKRAAMMRTAEAEGLDTGKSKRVKRASRMMDKGSLGEE